MTANLNIRIDEELHQKLRKAAYEKEMSINTIVKLALNEWLRNNENYEE